MNWNCRKYATRTACVALMAVAASSAYSVGWTAFTSWDSISGVSVLYDGNLNPAGFNVGLSSGATMVLGGTTYNILNIFGFFSLNSTGDATPGGVWDLNATSSDGDVADENGWKWESENDGHAPAHAVGGWDNNPKNFAITAGNNLDFTYASLNVDRINAFGFHFSYYDPINGSATSPLTAYFKGQTGGFRFQDVPEPVSTTLVAASALLFLKRRMRRRTA